MNIKKKLVLCVVTMSLGVFLNQSMVWAKLSVAPQYVVFDKGMSKVQNVSVINNSDKEKTYNVKLLHYRQKEDGSYETVEKEENDNKFADSLIFFGPRRFTLAPKEVQTIKIQKKPKADLEAGEYKSHMLFQEAEDEKPMVKETNPNAKGMSFTITGLYGVAIPVVVRNGDLIATAEFKNVKHTKEDQKDLITFDLLRDGNKSLHGDVVVKYQDKQIGILKGINVFLSVKKRNLSVALKTTDLNVKDLEGKTLTVEYISDGKVLTSSEVVY